MTELNKIKCDRKGCDTEHLEEHFNQGHPAWGHVAGIYDDKTGADRAHLCPEHMKMITEFLNGKDLKNDMG